MAPTHLRPLDIATEVHPRFPAFAKWPGFVFAENAGGSQVLGSVADCVSEYLLECPVQLYADSPLSLLGESRVLAGTCAVAALINASSPQEIVFGSSTTQLVQNVSRAIETSLEKRRKAQVEGREVSDGEMWEDGDEIIVSSIDHEANRGPWTRLAERYNLTVKPWSPEPVSTSDPFSVHLSPTSLASLVTPKTRLVAFTACSNILGGLNDVQEAVRVAKERSGGKAWVCVDAVAYAPHRRIDVKKWGVDFVVFSLYKTYGAHVSAMYASTRAQAQLMSPINHFFLSARPYKFQPGGPQFELAYSCSAVVDYLVSLGLDGSLSPNPRSIIIDWRGVFDHLPETRASSNAELPLPPAKDGMTKMSLEQVNAALDRAFERIAAHEATLLELFMEFLKKKRDEGVRVVGLPSVEGRVPTVSFVVTDHEGKVAVQSSAFDKVFGSTRKSGIRVGHAYAYRLVVDHLGLDAGDGVVRVSLVHYNTPEEVKWICKVIDDVLEQARASDK